MLICISFKNVCCVEPLLLLHTDVFQSIFVFAPIIKAAVISLKVYLTLARIISSIYFRTFSLNAFFFPRD